MEEQASGWVDVTLSPAGAWPERRLPSAGAIIVLTSQRPPPKQALDWLLAADRVQHQNGRGGRGPSPAPYSRGATPEPNQDAPASLTGRRGSSRSSRSPSPLPEALHDAAGGGAQHGRGDEKSEVAALAAQSDRVARRMRYAPPDLDGGAAADVAAAGEGNIESGEMMQQLADCLTEDGEISESAAEAASLATEAATCSLVDGRGRVPPGGPAAWLEPNDIMAERHDTAAEAQQQQQQQRQQPQGGGKPPMSSWEGGRGGPAGSPAQRFIIAGGLQLNSTLPQYS